MRKMMNLCFVKRSGFDGPFKAHNIFYAIDPGDRIPYAGKESAALVRRQLLRMGDNVVKNRFRDDEVCHGSLLFPPYAHVSRATLHGGLDSAADGVVQTKILDLRIWAAQWTGRIFGAADFAELHLERVVDHQLIRDRFTDPEDLLDGL